MSIESEQFHGVIYQATNKENGKGYIGQTGNFDKRKLSHIGAAINKRDDYYFHNALRKYGVDGFEWEILYECNIVTILKITETMKIISHHTHVSEGKGYNCTWGGEGLLPGHRHSDETRKKMSESGKVKIFTENHRKNLSISHKKENLSIETITNMSESKKGSKNSNFGKHFSVEIIKKFSASRQKYSDEQINEAINLFNGGYTLKEVSEKMNISKKSISNWFWPRKGRQKVTSLKPKPKKKASYSIEFVSNVIEMINSNMPFLEISKKTGAHLSTIYRINKKSIIH